MNIFVKIIKIFFLTVLLSGSHLFAQNLLNYQDYYYADGEAIFWKTDSTSVNIIVNNMKNYNDIAINLQKIFNSPNDEVIYDDEDDNIIVNSMSLPFISKDSIIDAISINYDDITFFTYSKVVNGSRIWLRNEVYVKMREDRANFSSFAQPVLNNYNNISVNYEGDFEYRIVCQSENDVLEIANQLHDTTQVVYSTPDFYSDGSLNSTINDPLFYLQWGLKHQTITNPLAYRSSTNAEDAWFFFKNMYGSIGSDLKVAVIGDGVEEHEDIKKSDGTDRVLKGHTVGNFAFNNGRPKSEGKHEQCCAGIIAASQNNIGVAGIAPNVRIIPIRIQKNNGKYFSNNNIAKGIKKSWKEYGAKVLSNSWGGGASHSKITEKINNAVDNNIVVVFAAGNDNSSVWYPANLSKVIAVGATDKNGIKAGFSNYGSDLDVVAPGVDIPTTDREVGGYNLTSEYFLNFGGTSAAAPHVAALAALLFGINPDFTSTQVRDIIESTAYKTGGCSYQTTSGRPNGTWCSQTGYGLIDIHKAVVTAWSLNKSISGNASINRCQTYTYQFSYSLPAGYSLHWRFNDGIIMSGQGTSTITIQAVSKTSSTSKIYVDIIHSGAVIATVQKNVTISGSNTTTSNIASENFTITSNTTWTGNKVLGVNATIAPGKTLTVSGNIYLINNARIITEPGGGKLVINEGKLIPTDCSSLP